MLLSCFSLACMTDATVIMVALGCRASLVCSSNPNEQQLHVLLGGVVEQHK